MSTNVELHFITADDDPFGVISSDGLSRRVTVTSVTDGDVNESSTCALTAAPVIGAEPITVDAFAQITGLHPDDLAASPLCSLVAPMTIDARSVTPSALWHPVFWIGPWADPHDIEDPETGELRLESLDEWLMRLAVFLEASGAYDPTSGAWVDMLGAVGIDFSNAVDVARLTAWQSGAADPTIDALALTLEDVADAFDWTFPTARILVVEQGHEVASMTADALVADLIELQTLVNDPTVTPAEVALLAAQLLTAAGELDSGLPTAAAVAAVQPWIAETNLNAGELLSVMASPLWQTTLRELAQFAEWHRDRSATIVAGIDAAVADFKDRAA